MEPRIAHHYWSRRAEVFMVGLRRTFQCWSLSAKVQAMHLFRGISRHRPDQCRPPGRLKSEGHRGLSTRWVDTVKNFFERREGRPCAPLLYKGRLLVRSDLEYDPTIRMDRLAYLRARKLQEYPFLRRIRETPCCQCRRHRRLLPSKGGVVDHVFKLAQPVPDGLEGAQRGGALFYSSHLWSGGRWSRTLVAHQG